LAYQYHERWEEELVCSEVYVKKKTGRSAKEVGLLASRGAARFAGSLPFSGAPCACPIPLRISRFQRIE
jgi:hypothetical protein